MSKIIELKKMDLVSEKKEISEMAFEIAFSIIGDTVDKEDVEKIMPTAKALFRLGYRKQSEVLKDFIKQIEKKFGKSCSEEYQFTFIEMLSTDLEELAEKYGEEA